MEKQTYSQLSSFLQRNLKLGNLQLSVQPAGQCCTTPTFAKINKLTTTSINVLAVTAYLSQVLSDLVIGIRQNIAAAYVGYIMNEKTLLIYFAIFLLVLQKWKEFLQAFYVSQNKENILHEFFCICLWLVLYVDSSERKGITSSVSERKKWFGSNMNFVKLCCVKNSDFSFCFSIK